MLDRRGWERTRSQDGPVRFAALRAAARGEGQPDPIHQVSLGNHDRRMRERLRTGLLAPGNNPLPDPRKALKEISPLEDVPEQLLRGVAYHQGWNLGPIQRFNHEPKARSLQETGTAPGGHAVTENSNRAYHYESRGFRILTHLNRFLGVRKCNHGFFKLDFSPPALTVQLVFSSCIHGLTPDQQHEIRQKIGSVTECGRVPSCRYAGQIPELTSRHRCGSSKWNRRAE